MAICEQLATTDKKRRRYRLTSPVDLSPIGEFECATAEDVAAAVDRATIAQRAWAEVPVAERVRIVRKARKLVVARQDEITATVMRETGKVPTDALGFEVIASADAMEFHARRAPKLLKPKKSAIHAPLGLVKTLRTVYKPLGVVGIITPWNCPFVLSMVPVTQALLAGNAVILKGSEVTPGSARLVESVYREAGLPAGVLQALDGDGETGAALIEADVQKISFTGSVATGRKVGEACGRRLIPCVLELGGNGAMLVCDDADLEFATDAALLGSCINTGHYCCATQRVFVVAPLYERFVARVGEKARALRQGRKFGVEEDIGPVFWDRQLATIVAHVDDAVRQGARLVTGGKRNSELGGLYYEVTVLADCHEQMQVMRQETFGPVVSIQRVADEAEAVRRANDSSYGLVSTVIAGDRERGYRLALQLETGSASVNDIAVTFGIADAPFGGVKMSGVGTANGSDGVLNWAHAFPVVLPRFALSKVLGAYPYTSSGLETSRRVLRWLWG